MIMDISAAGSVPAQRDIGAITGEILEAKRAGGEADAAVAQARTELARAERKIQDMQFELNLAKRRANNSETGLSRAVKDPVEDPVRLFAWMSGGTTPFDEGDVVIDVEADPGVPVRMLGYFDGSLFRFSRKGSRIDAQVVRWIRLPPVSDSDTMTETEETV